MSSRALLLLPLLVAVPGAAAAQESAALGAEVRRLEQVVDSLQRGFGELSSLATATPEIPVAAPRHDDLELLTVEGFRLWTNRSPLPVREGATIAWRRSAAFFGDALTRASIAPLVIQAIDPDSARGEWDDVADLTVHWDLPADQLASQIADRRAPRTDEPALVGWLAGSPRPTLSSRAVLARVYLGLVLSPYSSGRDCALAAVDACLPALRLLPDSALVTRAYPTAHDRRQAAATLGRGLRLPAIQPSLDRCLEQGEDAGCTAVIEAVNAVNRPPIADVLTRRTLLEFSVHSGGPGAYTRLLAARGRPMGERLAAAAGLPLDTLLLRWRAELTRAGRGSDPWSLEILGGGIVWVVALALGAMTSSRWRID